jgi:NADPH:quinone reductase-like Zn-dependent oxidoreductase
MEQNLELVSDKTPEPKPNQHLIRVVAACLNSVDYKLVEIPVIGSFMASKPATPGVDIAGEIVVPAAESSFKQGDRVFGGAGAGLAAAGGLAEYALASKDEIALIPAGVSFTDAATLPVTAVTAYLGIVPHVKPGDHILFNGGSGGVGLMATQIAKIKDCHVTVICSTRNVDLCKRMGADEVVDYTKGSVTDTLKGLGYKFDLIFDGVGNDHALYWKSNQYTNPGAKFVYIAFTIPWDISFAVMANVLPGFLGGQKTKLIILFAEAKPDVLNAVAKWMQEGKLKAQIDSRLPMTEVPDGYKKLRTNRATGKIVIDVASA